MLLSVRRMAARSAGVAPTPNSESNAAQALTRVAASIIQFVISAVIIIVAGAALAQFGDLIAHRTKLGGLSSEASCSQGLRPSRSWR
jgi:hypothetical protein